MAALDNRLGCEAHCRVGLRIIGRAGTVGCDLGVVELGMVPAEVGVRRLAIAATADLGLREPARMMLVPRIEINEAHAGIQLAEQGKGITIVLSYMVADALRIGRLIPVLGNYALPPVPVHLIHAQCRIIAPKVRAFVFRTALPQRMR